MPEAIPASFPCPECRTPLRLRDRRFVGAVFPCPDCGTSLILLSLRDGSAVVQRAEPPAPENQPQARPAKSLSGRPLPGKLLPGTRGIRTAKSPSEELGVTLQPSVPRNLDRLRSWVIVGTALCVGLGLLSWWVSIPGGESAAVVNKPADQALTPAESTSKQKPDSTIPTETVAAGPAWIARPGDSVQQRLEKLGLRLQDYEQRHGAWPIGVPQPQSQPARQHWSWQAVLEQEQFPQLIGAALPTKSDWQAPLHERFVRRQILEFQNPLISTLVSELGFPATHFVGISGVGTDAADLPAEHSRAGIFRRHSATKTRDVQDGLSNTMAVAGVNSQLGSWAEGDRATLRAVTTPPYVQGPDGLSTGSATEMLVLMADGSVRSLTQKTDPRIVRRLAAMADGLDLDLQIPGEPGDRISPPTTPPSAPAQPQLPAVARNPPDDPPVSALPPTASQPVGLTVIRPDPALVRAQRLNRFTMPKPLPRRELFSLIEDLFQRPIRWPADSLGPAEAALSDPIMIQAENLSVEELLQRLLADTDLELEVLADSILLKRRSARP